MTLPGQDRGTLICLISCVCQKPGRRHNSEESRAEAWRRRSERHAQGREMLAINSLRAVCDLSPQSNCISLHCSVSCGAWSFIFVPPPPQCQSCSSPPYERGRGKHNNEQVACIKLSPRVCTSFFPFPASSRGNKTFCSYWIVLLHFPFFSWEERDRVR